MDPERVAILRRYLNQAGQFTDVAMARYIEGMQRARAAPATINRHLSVVRTFCRRFGQRPPRPPRGWRFNGKRDSRHIALTPERLREMIAAARGGAAGVQATAAMCLASVYGMRIGEIAAVGEEDVDLPGQRIYIRTEKEGIQRWCHLPPEVAQWLPAPMEVATARALGRCFGDLWAAVTDDPRPKGTGWHAVRRQVARELGDAGIPAGACVRFLRWQAGEGGSGFAMFDLYSHPSHEAGQQGLRPVVEGEQGSRGYDAAVWDAHPLLPLWR